MCVMCSVCVCSMCHVYVQCVCIMCIVCMNVCVTGKLKKKGR